MLKMTSRERVLTALAHKEPDMVPITEFVYSRPLYREVIGKVPSYYSGEAVMNCSHKIGYDLAIIPFGGFGGFKAGNSKDGEYKDEWHTTYKKDESTWPVDAPVGFPIKDRSDWKNYVIPDPKVESRLTEVKAALKLSKEYKMSVFGSIRGPFSSAWLLFGIEDFCLNLYDDPEFVDEVITKCTDFFIEGGCKMLEAGVDAIVFADDYGSNEAPFISPSLFNRHILPQVRRMIDIFKKNGGRVIMHSDGHIKPFLQSLVDAGIQGYHPIEKQAHMDLLEVKQKHGKDICLIGNVNNKTTLVTGSVEDVMEETRECIKIAAPGGGYILASDHSVHDDIPNENVFALYEAGRKYGEYPISL